MKRRQFQRWRAEDGSGAARTPRLPHQMRDAAAFARRSAHRKGDAAMDTVPAIEDQRHALQPTCRAQRLSTGITYGAPGGGGRRDARHRQMQPGAAKPRRRPRRDALPSLPDYCATGDGDPGGPPARDGVSMRHSPGVHHVRASHSIPAQCLAGRPVGPERPGIMTRLRMAALFVAVASGDYAALMLIDGQLIVFGVTAAICAGSLVAAGLIAYTGRRRRKAAARGRDAVWERRDRQAAATGQQCPLCGGARQKASDSPRFVDRQGTRECGECAPALNPEPTR